MCLNKFANVLECFEDLKARKIWKWLFIKSGPPDPWKNLQRSCLKSSKDWRMIHKTAPISCHHRALFAAVLRSEKTSDRRRSSVDVGRDESIWRRREQPRGMEASPFESEVKANQTNHKT